MSRCANGCLASFRRTGGRSDWICNASNFRWPVGMPLVRPLGDGLFEVRTSLPDKTISRVLFCFHEGELFALHGFIKKTRATPQELKLARKRKLEVENG